MLIPPSLLAEADKARRDQLSQSVDELRESLKDRPLLRTSAQVEDAIKSLEQESEPRKRKIQQAFLKILLEGFQLQLFSSPKKANRPNSKKSSSLQSSTTNLSRERNSKASLRLF